MLFLGFGSILITKPKGFKIDLTFMLNFFFKTNRSRITFDNGKKCSFKINDYNASNVIQINRNNILIIAHDYCTQSNGNYSFLLS